MFNFEVEASAWTERELSSQRMDARATGAWQLFLGLGLVLVWFVVMTGLYGGPYFILSFAGIVFPVAPHVFGLIWVGAQFVLFPFVRRKSRGFQFTRAEDNGEIIAVPPPRNNEQVEAYGQDNDFSFRRGYVGVFFSAQIAIDEALREFAFARATRRFDKANLARLAAILMAPPRKLSFAQLETLLPGVDLPPLLAQAARLPGFHIHTQHPQGVSLTDHAQEGVLVSGIAGT